MSDKDFKNNMWPFDNCGKYYVSIHNLRRHIKAQHSLERPYKCKVCHKAFALAQYLREHSNVHTGERPYKCELLGCAQTYTQAGKLAEH